MRASYLPAVAMLCVLARGDVSVAASEHGTTLTSDVTSSILPRRLLRTDVTTPEISSVPVEGTPTLAYNATQAKGGGADDSSDDSDDIGKDGENDSSEIGKEEKDDSSDDPLKSGKACF
ncbi:unnamed protein product [Hyaloperonospora brassicae]|uniref:RxLR effector candidate protein n=1 Tax=Hyaloperonospora brassicae TaxID=162125 RepID=A0AAV0UCX2_HYABA|nr:unnamed protein product [Hyaloperonospora brassicae]